MKRPAIVFTHTGLTVHAARNGEHWLGELLDERGEVQDVFAYTREAFPGAVIGALRVRDVAFLPQLAPRMWLHTEARPGRAEPRTAPAGPSRSKLESNHEAAEPARSSIGDEPRD